MIKKMLVTILMTLSLSVLVSGKPLKVVEPKGVSYLSVNVLERNNETLFPFRAICDVFNKKVSWNSKNNKVYMYIGFKKYLVKGTIINGITYVDLKELQRLLNLTYTKELNTLSKNINNNEELIETLRRSTGYSKNDLYWLSRIVSAEAKGENYYSKLAVANVILNRVKSSSYPDNIKDVIFDKKHGVQFTPTINGAIYENPTNESYIVAIDSLNGYNNAKDALFFLNPKIAKSNWIMRNRQFAFKMGNHSFYY